MLAPDSRAVLLDLLRPPPGYELGHAVATTFTLDLSAALVPPLAFVARGLSASTNQVSLLNAVRSISDRIDIFCQAGQIAVPRTSSRLIDFVEPMVHAVREPRPGYLFHPKVWYLEYFDEAGTPAYRLIVQSRNLTNDASWDAVLSLDGVGGTRRHAGNAPLVGLLSSLPSRAVHAIDPRREERITALAESFRRVEWTRPDRVQDIAFHVFGVRGHPPRADFSGYRNLVVSPFLTSGGLARVSDSHGDVQVVSRPDAFDVLDPATVATIAQAFIVNPLADLLDNDSPDEPATVTTDDSPRTVLGGLHAKFFVAERARMAHLFLGSANATNPAFTGNVEILVELIGSTRDLGVDAMLGKDSLGPILEPYAAVGGADPDPADEARRDLDQFLRQVAAITLDAEVSDDADGYRIHFTGARAVSVPAAYQVAFELHTRPALASHLIDGDTIDVTFGPMPLADVTPFLTVLVTTGEGIRGGAVLIAHLINDPPGRFDEILARQLDTPEKFLQFLAQLLGLDGAALFGLGSGDGLGGPGSFGITPTGIFELMVRALADKPGALDTLAELIPRLGGDGAQDSPLPTGFMQLWDAVDRARLDVDDAAR